MSIDNENHLWVRKRWFCKTYNITKKEFEDTLIKAKHAKRENKHVYTSKGISTTKIFSYFGTNIIRKTSGSWSSGKGCFVFRESMLKELFNVKSPMLRVIIAGGRDFNNKAIMKEVCDHMLQRHKKVEIVSGNANGADRIGEQYALLNLHILTRFPADWNYYGKSAGPIRNKQMAEYADALIVFWDGKSRGTANMIKTAKKVGLKVKIHRYN